MTRLRVGNLLWLVAGLAPLSGCARVGSAAGHGQVPNWIIRVTLDFAGPIDDTSYYFIAINAANDFGASGPLPVAAGPYWGNGWGTGSITHFIRYNQGRYLVFRQNRRVTLTQTGGGIVDAKGSPTNAATGEYELTVRSIALGAATLTGAGVITRATNRSDQNAGAFRIATNAAGKTIAGQVSFTPAANGGRDLTPAERAALRTLNAGGATLAADSLSAFGLALAVGAPRAGTQTLTVKPTLGSVSVLFRPVSGTAKNSTGTLTANSSTATDRPPLPGITLRTTALVRNATAKVRSETAPTSTLLGLPYEAQNPFGGSTLDVTLDAAMLGANVTNLDVNFITTTQLIFDPTVTDPAQHCYDGLGLRGNDFLNFTVQQTRTLANGDRFTPERSGDPTLRGPATQTERNAVDLIDWTITISRL